MDLFEQTAAQARAEAKEIVRKAKALRRQLDEMDEPKRQHADALLREVARAELCGILEDDYAVRR